MPNHARAPGPCPTDVNDFHPLEAIPYFRRFRPGPWRNVAYTAIFNTILGTIFWVTGMGDNPAARTVQVWLLNVLATNVAGFSIHGLFGVGTMLGIDRKVSGPYLTTAYYTIVSLIGVLCGFAAVAWVLDIALPKWLLSTRWVASVAVSSLVISAILSVIFFARARSARAEAALQAEKLRVERIEREAALATLRALQAQIEPHFLFNTLANATSLIDIDPATAKRMLESFIRFLRASLAATRSATTTLGREGELIAAYLDVLQVRMGARLRYRIDIPEALAAFELPPMLVQPVVENAIGHGLEPKVEGGELTLRAVREDGAVAIEVADTGVGFGATTRGGVGLTNLRERLHLLYGERGALQIGENAPGGMRVRIVIPQ